MRQENDASVRFLYATAPGRCLLQLIQRLHLDRWAVRFLRSGWSRPYMFRYAARHGIPLTPEQRRSFRSYRDFFARTREEGPTDRTPGHLISPCDGLLSAYPIARDSSFAIKGSRYGIRELLDDEKLAENYPGGTCLVFRLCASDYHHYCYIDDGYQGRSHYIEGQLHSVQPIACATVPVFTLNRRCWCLLSTENFGPVVQTEIGALVVGGIANNPGNSRCRRGQEKGHFELAGSTIVLLFEPGRVVLRPELAEALEPGTEIRVRQGQWIGDKA